MYSEAYTIHLGEVTARRVFSEKRQKFVKKREISARHYEEFRAWQCGRCETEHEGGQICYACLLDRLQSKRWKYIDEMDFC